MNPLEQLRAENPRVSQSTDALSGMRNWNSDKVPNYGGYAKTQEYRNIESVNKLNEKQIKWYAKAATKTKEEYVDFIDAFTEGMLATPRVEEKQWNPWRASQEGSRLAIDTYQHAITDFGTRMENLYDVYTEDGIAQGLNPFHKPVDKFKARAEALVGGVGVFAAPIMAIPSYLSAYPGIGHIADGVNAVFMGAMSGAGEVASEVLWNMPITDETKQKLDQPVRELAGLGIVLPLGKAFTPAKQSPAPGVDVPVTDIPGGGKVPIETGKSSIQKYTPEKDLPTIEFGEGKPKTDAVTEVVPDRPQQAPSDLPVIEFGEGVKVTPEIAARAKILTREITEGIKNDKKVVSELESLERSLEGEIATEAGQSGRLGRIKRYPDYERAESEVLTELELAERGRRWSDEAGEQQSQPSTFPEWLPKDEYKITKTDINRVVELLEKGQEPRANATKQRAIMDSIVSEIESRVDTSKGPTTVEFAETMPETGGTSAMGTTPKTPTAQRPTEMRDSGAVPPTEVLQPLSGTGEIAVPRLTQRMRSIASDIERSLSEMVVNGERRRINVKVQAEMGARLAETDPVRAKRVAMGREAPPKAGEFGPEPMTESIVREALVEKAIRDGDINTLFELGSLDNPRSMAEIRHGQELAVLQGRNRMANPVTITQDVRKVRMEAYKDKKGRTAEQARNEIAVEMDKKASKGITDKQALDDFLKGLEC